MAYVVCHREFEGEHEMSDGCWCRPVLLDADLATEEDVERVVRESDKEDG
jgi:hypothetical protein